MRHGTRGDQVEIGSQVEKRRPGIKMAEKGPKKFSRFMRHFPTTHGLSLFTLVNKTTMHTMAYNGSQVNIDDICRN